MIWYLYLILFFEIACSFVFSYNTMTALDFIQWHCESICTDSTLQQHVKGICLQIETNLQDRYEDRTIKSYSKCEKDISVEFQIEDGSIFSQGFRREVGMCYLSPTATKCITKGSQENSLFIYSYTSKVCRDPQEIDYDFSAAPFTGAFITIVQFQKWKCSDICTKPALKRHVKAICLQISQNIADRYDDNAIKTKSGCEDETSVEFEIEEGRIFSQGFRRHVGMCYASPRVTKCITKGADENSVFVYSYSNNVCHQPKQIDYDFSTTPSTDTMDTELSKSTSTTSTAEGKGDSAITKTIPLSSSSNPETPKAIKKEGKSKEIPLSSSPVPSIPMTEKQKGLICSMLDWIKGWFRR